MQAGRVVRGFVFVLGVLAGWPAPGLAAVALDETELSQVVGRGLDGPVLAALTRQDQSGSYVSAEAALAALAQLDANGLGSLQRQMEQQQARTAALGMQQPLRLAQVTFSVSQFPGLVLGATLPMLTLPLFGLPGLGALPLPGQGGSSSDHKH